MIDSSKLQAALNGQKQVMQTLDTRLKEIEVEEEVTPSGVLPSSDIKEYISEAIEIDVPSEEMKVEAIEIEVPSEEMKAEAIEIDVPSDNIEVSEDIEQTEPAIITDTPKHLEEVLDKTGVDLVTPSEYTEPASGTIRTYKSKIEVNYPFIQIIIDDVESFPDRLLKSINNMLDKETNDNQKIIEEKRITVGMKIILRTGQVKEGILGTLERKRLIQFLNLLKNVEIEGYLKPNKQIEKKYLYALV